MRCRPAPAAIVLLLLAAPAAIHAQAVTERGFVEGRLFLFPQDAPADPVNLVGDVMAREEVFAKPATWLQVAAGVDLRANSHDQVERAWRFDFGDRSVQRPALSLRRLSATLHYRRLTVDAGKQFIRWGKTDIVTPTDHFAPRDFLNVIDTELLAVACVRTVVQFGDDTLDAVIVPRFTPSRVPLLDQRWTAVPAAASNIHLVDAGAQFGGGLQAGVRWGHVGAGYEYSLSYFDGFNHLPNIEAATIIAAAPGSSGAAGDASIVIRRVYPAI